MVEAKVLAVPVTLTAPDGAEARLLPEVLRATTRKVYVPELRPLRLALVVTPAATEFVGCDPT